MIEDARSIVCDTGPIIHLDELGCLDLLADFEKILLSLSVVEEIEKHLQLKNKILVILDFLLAKGSVTAYLLREDIL